MNGASVLHWWSRVPWSHSGPHIAHLTLVGFFSILQDMCKIALMYCRLIKERAEALSLSEQKEAEAANRVGSGSRA